MSASQTSTLVESNEEMLVVTQLKEWVENEADFKSRKDDDFLLMFLRSCDFEQELAQKTLTKYYQNKINMPQWWTNRAHTDSYVQAILDQNIYTSVMCLFKDQPAIGFGQAAKLDLTKVSVDEYGKAATLAAEYTIRLENCQLNGFVGIVDAKDFIFRPAYALLVLKFARSALDAFYIGLPIKLREVHVFNVSYMMIWLAKTLVYPFLPTFIKERVHFHHEELSSMRNYLPPEWLPEELGGTAGPLSKHHTASWENFLLCNDHLLDEDNFGYGK